MPKKNPNEEHPFNQITQIPLNEIDPKSTINVRQTGIDENVQRIKTSIQSHGYLPEFPVVLRPHPDPQSPYAYESVSGQCRMKAAFALNLEKIPAIIDNLTDDDALKRSFMENEKRGELSFQDYTYWIEKKWNEFTQQGIPAKTAFQKTAQFWDISIEKAEQYFALHALPTEVKKMVDKQELPKNAALAIVKSSRDPFDIQKGEQTMTQRAQWFCSLDREQRKQARQAINNSNNKTTIEEVQQKHQQLTQPDKTTINVRISNQEMNDLLAYGTAIGISKPADIAQHIVIKELRARTNPKPNPNE